MSATKKKKTSLTLTVKKLLQEKSKKIQEELRLFERNMDMAAHEEEDHYSPKDVKKAITNVHFQNILLSDTTKKSVPAAVAPLLKTLNGQNEDDTVNRTFLNMVLDDGQNLELNLKEALTICHHSDFEDQSPKKFLLDDAKAKMVTSIVDLNDQNMVMFEAMVNNHGIECFPNLSRIAFGPVFHKTCMRSIKAFAKVFADQPHIRLPHIKELDVSMPLGFNDKFNDQAPALTRVFLPVLKALPSLHTLILANSRLRLQGVAGLGGAFAHHRVVPGLRVLDLSNNNINGDGATEIASLLGRIPLLERLDLRRNLLRTGGVEALMMLFRENPQSLMHLLAIDLSDNGIGKGGAKHLKTIFRENSRALATLRELHLTENRLGAQGAEHIFRIFVSPPPRNALTKLQQLSLDMNDIGSGGMRAFEGIFERNRHAFSGLEELSLSGNSIRDEGMQAFANIFMSHHPEEVLPRLRVLNLSRNEIGDEGARALAGVFLLTHPRALPQLQSLSLDGKMEAIRRIGPEGASSLAKALQRVPGLRRLGLGYNNIQDDGAKAIAETLKSTPDLAYLDLNGNWIRDEGANAIANTCLAQEEGKVRYVKSLQYLHLSYNKVSDEVKERMDKLFLRRRPDMDLLL